MFSNRNGCLHASASAMFRCPKLCGQVIKFTPSAVQTHPPRNQPHQVKRVAVWLYTKLSNDTSGAHWACIASHWLTGRHAAKRHCVNTARCHRFAVVQTLDVAQLWQRVIARCASKINLSSYTICAPRWVIGNLVYRFYRCAVMMLLF